MNRKLLLAACEFAAKAISGKTSLPVLECVHLKGDGERLTVTGYNLDLYARMSVESDLVIDCCAPAKRLAKVLSSWPDDDIGITISDDQLTLTGGNGRRAPVDSLPGEQFPPITGCDGNRFSIPGDAIGKVLCAACPDESRYVLHSVLLDTTHAVATDGKRMHSAEIKGPAAAVILPLACAKLLSAAEGEMRCSGGRFVATGDGWEMGGKVIDGNYPGWRAITPGYDKGWEIPEGFTDVISRADSNMGPVSSPYVVVTPGRVTTEGHDEEFQSAFGSFRITPQYLLEAIKAAGSKARLCREKGDAREANNRMVVVTGEGFVASVMPHRFES